MITTRSTRWRKRLGLPPYSKMSLKTCLKMAKSLQQGLHGLPGNNTSLESNRGTRRGTNNKD